MKPTILSFYVLLTWLAWSAALVGMGSIIFRQCEERAGLAEKFWVGLGVTIAILEMYHLFRPIDLAVVILLAGVGAAGWLWDRVELARELGRFGRNHVGLLCGLGLVAACIAFRCIGPCQHYDTGLYGASALRWDLSYPVIPGLANVYGRLGYQSGVFLGIAAMGQGVWADLGDHLFVGMVTAAAFASILPAFVRLSGTTGISSSDWFMAMLLVPAASWAGRREMVGTDTDVPATAVCLLGAALLSGELSREEQESEGKNYAPSHGRLITAMTLFALGAAFKLSTAVLAGGGWILAGVVLLRRKQTTANHKAIRTGVALLMGIVGTSIITGLVISGYAFYPNALLSLPVDWRVPEVSAKLDAAWVHSWARIPWARFADTRGFAWLGPWYWSAQSNRPGFDAPLLVTLIGLIAVLGGAAKKGVKRGGLWLLVPSAAGLAFWFVQAPDLRFGEPAIWMFAASLGAVTGTWLAAKAGWTGRALGAVVVLCLAVWCLSPGTIWESKYRPLLGIQDFSRLRKPQTSARQTKSGLTVYTLIDAESCWDASLPCTPYFNATLRLRKEDLSGGFVSESKPEQPDGSVAAKHY